MKESLSQKQSFLWICLDLPARYRLIDKIAKKYNLKVIEDAAQSFGGLLEKKRLVLLEMLLQHHFTQLKPLGCYGDGGAIFTNDDRFSRGM